MPQAPQQPKKKKTWLWVLLSVVVVLLILAGLFIWWIFGGASGSAKKVADQWLTQLTTGQIDQAYAGTASGFKEGTNREAFQTFIDAYPIMTNVKESKFSSIERTSSGGQSITTLDGTLTGEDGSTSPIEVTLIQENGDWRIYNVDLRGLSN